MSTPHPAAASFPRRWALTRRFTLGQPRGFRTRADGRVVFLRSNGPTDPVQRLWVAEDGGERCVLDPAALPELDEGALPEEERARRERVREQAAGVVGFDTDRTLGRAVVALGGRVLAVDLDHGAHTTLPLDGPVVDPRLSPDGTLLAFVRDGAVHTVGLDLSGLALGSGHREAAPAGLTGPVRTLLTPEAPGVRWGVAEFIAAEEMGRGRGLWWSPDGSALAVASVDEREVAAWYLHDAADPARAPRSVRFPAAGQRNATVGLSLVDLAGNRRDIIWDTASLPYLAAVTWRAGPPLTLTLQSRDQRRVEIVTVSQATAQPTTVATLTRTPWVELVPGSPQWAGDTLLTVRDDDATDTRRLYADATPLSPAGLQVRRLISAEPDAAIVEASGQDPTEVGVWHITLADGSLTRLDLPGGVTAAAGSSACLVLARSDLEVTEVAVHRNGHREPLTSLAARPTLPVQVQWARLGARRLAAALLLPADHDGVRPLPVLLDPYGGPHAQRVLRRGAGFALSQWFAEAGFAVLVVDGRGSPGRGPAWEAALAGDLATGPLADQLDALESAARLWPCLDLDRVAIRGWSFGGFLAALAALRAPERIHAAVAGAPVTDWRLYDTHYTERYLGDPAADPDTYTRSSLLSGSLLTERPSVQRPLLLIHGLADDNVVAAHTLRLSTALLAAQHPHEVLPLSGITHMAADPEVAEALVTREVAFLRGALEVPEGRG